MKSIGEMTQAEVGAFVHSHLRENSINVVLSGAQLFQSTATNDMFPSIWIW